MLKNISHKYILLLYVFISLVVYYATEGAGMIFDFNGWTAHYVNGSYKDVLNSFGYQGLHQIEQLAFFSIYKLVHFNTFGWYFIFAFLHGVAAFVSYVFIEKWLGTCKINKNKNIAILSSFLFLISPFASDTVVNKITIHYLLVNIFLFGALYLLVIYYEKEKNKYLLSLLLLFILALFSLEISYIFPVLFSIIWVSLFYFNNKLKFSKKLLIPIIFPFLLLFSFLFLHKLLLGSFVGHYGSDVHLKFNFSEVYSTVVRYFASYIVLFDYWNYKYKLFASEIIINYSYLFFFLMFCCFSIVSFFAYKKDKKEWFLILIVFTLAVFSLAPVSNLYYAYLFPIENDRYSYLMSVFAYLFIVLLFFQIKNRSFKNIAVVFFILINTFYLIQNVYTFSKSSKLAWSLLNDFRWFDKEVILLTDIDNLSGAKMFSTVGDTTSFSESLKLHTKIDRQAHIKSVFQINSVNLTDSVIVTKIDKYNYRVEIAQWGNWFWKDMLGATSFENEWCKAEVIKEGRQFYNLQIKDTLTDYVFIYVAGDKWREVQ